MSHLNVDFDIPDLSALDQDELIQRKASMDEVLGILSGRNRSYSDAETFVEAADAELVRRAKQGEYKLLKPLRKRAYAR